MSSKSIRVLLRQISWGIIALGLVSLLFFAGAHAEELTPVPLTAVQLTAAQQSDADYVFTHFLSPFCPGRTLQDCPSNSATELKDQIKVRIAAGGDKHQIFNDLLGQFGEQYRAAPEAQGFGLLAWIAPAVFLLIGVFVIRRLVGGNRR